MEKDKFIYLHLMLDSLIKIKRYITGMTYEDFVADSKTQSAVIMQLQVIGELAKKIPEEITNEIDIPWKQIAGMRDMVSHDYFNLDIKIVWDTIMTRTIEAENKIIKYLDLPEPTT